jgi:hypothetical protein
MKTQKISSLILILLFVGFINTSKAIGENETKRSSVNHSTVLVDQAKAMIKYPDFAKNNKIQGFVYLSFSYDESGNFQVRDLNTNSLELSDYVVSELKNLKICPWGKSTENEYIIRFNFKLL